MPKLKPIECPHGTHVGDCPQCRIESLAAERDALAAHCAQLLSAGWRLKHELQQWSLTERDPQTSAVLAYWDSATDKKPSASLARLKAEWQAEALDWAYNQVVTPYSGAPLTLETRAIELRRQAEEPSA